MKKELLDEIINLKLKRQELEVECGSKDHDMHLFTNRQIEDMEHDMEKRNACVMLDAVNRKIREDEREFRRR